jgi:small subunit ribosomal protein S1
MASTSTSTPETMESFAALFEESLARQEMRSGEVITAEVVSVDSDFVIVNAGLKSESVINASEFKNDQGELEVAVGDFVKVAIEKLEDGFGSTQLSREKAKKMQAWLDLEEAMNEGKVVKGYVSSRVKGGLRVSVNGIMAFLPGSLVDIRPVKDTTPFENKEWDFKVIKLDRKRNNIVVSRRAVMEDSMGADREALMGSLTEGAVIKGIVKNITDYGAFVDLGGIDGLLHITDLAWRRVKHPSEVLTVGEEVEAKILKFDQEKNRVSLGIKQLGDDPWVALTRRYPVSTRLFGKVSNLTDYGAFVEIEPGIEGLVHVSEMDWTNKNIHPGKIAQLGDEVEVMILEIDEERRRLSLGMKQCKANPWDDFSATHAKNDKVSGQIKSITDFGVFIGLPGGIDGLVHLSDLSWTQSGEEAIRNFKKGDELQAVILAIDVEKERISLGVKQLTEDPNGGSTSVESEEKAAKPKAKSAAKASEVTPDDATAGTTNLGALLKAKLDSKK